jgi:AcrR family transcriptional regulator
MPDKKRPYRHFPDEASLFAACTAHWMAENPVPDIGAWARIEGPDERLRAALASLYRYYRRTARMLENLVRDETTSAVVRENFAGYRRYLAAARDALMRGRRSRGRARTRERAAIGHALAFGTWRSLALDEGLDDAQAGELVVRLVAA